MYASLQKREKEGISNPPQRDNNNNNKAVNNW